MDAILRDREPLVDVARALNMTVAGILAHQSALKGGELMKVPNHRLVPPGRRPPQSRGVCRRQGEYIVEIPAKIVYIDPEIHARPQCKRRLERVLPHVKCGDVRDLGPGDMQRVLDIGKRRHGKDDFGDDAALVFTTFDENRLPWFYHWRDEA